MTMSSASSLQWELESLGNIPREVVSILLGSIPVVPDPQLEAQVLESAEDQSRLEDRLSEDEEEEEDAIDSPQRHRDLKDVAMSVEIIQNGGEDGGGDDDSITEVSGNLKSKTRLGDHGEEEGVSSEESSGSRPWNVPDDDWAWSDEEPTTSKSTGITQQRQHGTSTHGGRGGNDNKQRRQTSSNERTGLGLSGVVMDGRNDSISSTPSRISSSRDRDRRASTGKLGATTAATAATAAVTASSKSEWKATHSHMTVAQDLKISVCDRGDYIVCASKKMFAVLTKTNSPAASTTPPLPSMASVRERKGWVLIGQGSGLDGPSDCITSVLCLPLYTPKTRQSQVYVVIGYQTGFIRIFNETGTLLVVQQLHHTPVISLKARIGSGKMPGEDDDEMTIVYEGGRVVCIEGESLWVALRVSNNQGKSQERNIHAAQAPTFAYKKWHLQNQDHMVDVISCGPARRRPTLSNGFSTAASSAMYTAKATERFVAVGSKPMMVFYASASTGRPLFSATSIASQVASRVTSAFYGLAKSIWSASPLLRPSSPSTPLSSTSSSSNQSHLSASSSPDPGKRWSTGNQTNTTTSSESVANPTAMAPATEVPAVLWLSDPQRCIRHVSLAPTPIRGAVYHYPQKLAAMTDSLGRVLLVDLEECEVIRMWKGLRGARCGWIQEEKLVPVARRSQKPASIPVSSASVESATHPQTTVNQEQQQKGERVEAIKEDKNDNRTIEFRRHLMLYLVIYAPKRGTAEIYPMRHGAREAVLHVGLGWKVCTTSVGPIGQPTVLSRHQGPSPSGSRSSSPGITNTLPSNADSGLSQCFMIGPSGEVRLIRRKPLGAVVS
ncbi:Rab3 GTPase-activating protein non-catalytic subunit [Actinomortierella wolfii]|nr:Rab3 GTPase-activating protein non-catalytic subunit [Actinomortierella wolfii]